MGLPALTDCINCLMFELSKVGSAPLECENTSCTDALVPSFDQRAVIGPCGVGWGHRISQLAPRNTPLYHRGMTRLPVLSTSDSRSQRELHERQSRILADLSQNQGIRNFRLSDRQEEADHGRTRSKAGKDAKDSEAQNPIERPDCTRTRATVILVDLMNPSRVMWCPQERAQCRCARIISVEISSTKRHE